MPDIRKIDHNFSVETKLNLNDICFLDTKDHPECIYGLIIDKVFRRMPDETAKNVNQGVYELNSNTSGGRFRFFTDSPYVAIKAISPDAPPVSHMSKSGMLGFDMYEKNNYVKSFIPPEKMSDGYEGLHRFNSRRKRQLTINFPLYNSVKDLYIGLQKGASFRADDSYRKNKKIVFYGSSITQGGCVSRPGLAYPTQVSMKLNCDFVNLGFSASAKGEPLMAEYIAGLDPDVFVMDYDHNAPTVEFLEATHEKFFRTFRELKKDVPIILMSAPDVRFHNGDWIKRRNIVYRTYQNAVSTGDKNVFFLDGMQLWGKGDWRICSSDALHPNDIGHYRMAQKLLSVIKKIMT